MIHFQPHASLIACSESNQKPGCPLQCALVVGALWLVEDTGIRKRILKLLHQKGRTLASLRSVLLEYRANLGDDGERRQPGGV